MSAFLGPIHYWLYNKIQLQQEIVEALYSLGNRYGLSLQKECDELYGAFVNKPLEERIDHGNIHGWLQEQVSRVEYRYAYSVTSLLKQDSSLMEELKSLLRDKGSQLGQSLASEPLNAPELFKVISDNLLDGMPCDHANRVISQDANKLVWARNTCVHTNYWEEVGGDISLYYELREAWIDGLARECGFTYRSEDEKTFCLIAEN